MVSDVENHSERKAVVAAEIEDASQSAVAVAVAIETVVTAGPDGVEAEAEARKTELRELLQTEIHGLCSHAHAHVRDLQREMNTFPSNSC